MKERRHIEREFGVPIPGEILPPQLWTQTSLKRLPPEGPLIWEELFGRPAPIVLDLGCGNGRFLIGSAVWRPDHDHLGVDTLPVVIRYATRRGNQRGLTNLRFAVIGAREFCQRWVSPGSVMEVHCYHPQPYPENSRGQRRLLTPEFLVLVHRILAAEGRFFLQTDNAGYWSYLRQVVPAFFEFHEQAGTWPDAPKGRTRREILALRRRLPVFRAWAIPRDKLSPEEIERLVKEVPQPIFEAGPPQPDLDELERE